MVKDNRNRRKMHKEPLLPFSRMNYILFGISILVIVLGYIALAEKPYNSSISLNVAPVLLVLGYVVMIPVSILYRKRGSKSAE